MGLLKDILSILDSRSFATIWFWVMLATVWTMVGRNVLGVPPDVIRRVPRDPQGPDTPEALVLLDWLSLVLPRWRLDPREGVWLLGLFAFVCSTLILLGFAYGLEMAQALVILLFPVVLKMLGGLWLASRLQVILAAAQAHRITPNEAAAAAARLMARYRTVLTHLPPLLLLTGFMLLLLWLSLSGRWL
ncbi:hypothetical protein PE067_16370 [Paracoccus sp. DMF-8]|uniref:hypothetical protein n=1 Tax=Paracoccus sp. DMF-8 TaxID=3019445 RepID=UPI0023E3CC97|nr:hypothetical protein [Paracoccus sp. DMF-8]MDF3607583.1 hypothetical protein [Paracoccus sp. DMF-8]